MSRKKGVKSPNSQGTSANTIQDAAANTYTPEQVIHSRLRRLASWEDIQSFFSKLIMMAMLLWILFGVLFGITPMQNNDMFPRISAGDLLLYYRLEDTFWTNDVVVLEKDGRKYTGRIVAKGGESVEITEDSQLRVNGSTVMETDIFYSTPRYGDEIQYPVNLNENQFFILCDYRDGAKDSRYFGPVERTEIKGKVITILRRSDL